MRAPLWLRLAVRVVPLLVASAGMAYAAHDAGPPAQVLTQGRPAGAVALAVLGDSDSHAYQDTLSFPPGSGARGGAEHARTFNWPEILARLRGRQLDLGPWLEWGTSGVSASVDMVLGLDAGRVPRKVDYLYNFANSGADCNDLAQGRFRQAPRLAHLMGKEPARWRQGIVVLRIGLNDWQHMLELQSREPEAAPVQAAIERCLRRHIEAIALLRQQQPGLRFLIVGIGNEIDDPGQFEDYRSAAETRNIREALDRYNGAMRALAERTPGAAFFDQDAWFQRLWGARGPDGEPDAYRTVTLGSGAWRVTNSAGDTPDNALLGDHHAGVAWNALWAQALVQRLKEAFGLPLAPVSDAELWRFLQPLVAPAAGPGVRARGS